MPGSSRKKTPPVMQEDTLFDMPGDERPPAPATPGEPPPCPHVNSPNARKGWFWELETDPSSLYYREYVHIEIGCRRSALPGRHKR